MPEAASTSVVAATQAAALTSGVEATPAAGSTSAVAEIPEGTRLLNSEPLRAAKAEYPPQYAQPVDCRRRPNRLRESVRDGTSRAYNRREGKKPEIGKDRALCRWGKPGLDRVVQDKSDQTQRGGDQECLEARSLVGSGQRHHPKGYFLGESRKQQRSQHDCLNPVHRKRRSTGGEEAGF